MNNDMLSEICTEQPWWCVRPQLVVTLMVLLAVCAALWIDTPVRNWMVRQAVQAELPEMQLFVKAGN